MTTQPAAAGTAAPPDPPADLLVGRARELRLLRASVLATPAVVVVTGNAGVGKSSLVRAALSPRESRVLVGHCHALRQPFPLGPVIDAISDRRDLVTDLALSPLAGALQPLLPELAGTLPPPLPALGDPAAERHRIFRALAELLDGIGDAALVLEDLHWADAVTCELLTFLVDRMPPRLRLVLTFRPEDLDRDSPLHAALAHVNPPTAMVRIPLTELAVADVHQLVVGRLGATAVAPEFSAYVHEQTAGLPFAVEELLRLLAARELLTTDALASPTSARWRLVDVPPAVRDSVLERARRLGPDLWPLLRAAAVLEVPSPVAEVVTVSGLDGPAAAAAVSAAVQAVLLTEQPDGRLSFQHSLARRAVYEALTPVERREAHLRAAEVLERRANPPLERLAHHFRLGDARSQWLRYSEAAADMFLSVGDERSAIPLLLEAYKDARADPRARVRLALKLGQAAYHHASWDETTRQVIQEVADDPAVSLADRGELRLALANLLVQSGDTTGASAAFAAAVDELRERPARAAYAMGNLAFPGRALTAAQALEWLRRAEAAAGAVDDPVVQTKIAHDRVTLLVVVGDPEGVRELDELRTDASSVPERRELIRGLSNAGAAAAVAGHYDRAARLFRATDTLADEVGYVRYRGVKGRNELVLDWLTGRWDGLAERCAAMAAATTAAPAHRAAGKLLGALVETVTGTPGRDVALLRRRLRAVDLPALRWNATVATGACGRLEAQGGDAAAALATVTPALDFVRSDGWWVWLAPELVPTAVRALAGLGRTDDAAALVAETASAARGREAPALAAALAEARGALAEAQGDPDRAAAAYRRAATRWAGLPRPWEAALARASLGRCLLAAGDERGAQAMVGALDELTRLGARRDAGRLRQELRAHRVGGSRVGPGRPGYGTALSPREREVAALVAEGLTNRDIAARLFLSPRTVEEHVARLLEKLGTTRRALYGRAVDG